MTIDEAKRRDLYQVLQVAPDAPAALLEQAYWHLAHKYHALIATDPSARNKLDELNAAYSVLISPVRRQHYEVERTVTSARGASAAPARGRFAAVPIFFLPRLPRLRSPLRLPRRRGLAAAAVASGALAVAALIAGVSLAPVAGVLLLGLGVAIALPIAAGGPAHRARTGRGPIPAPPGLPGLAVAMGRSRTARRSVADLYEQCPHLRPADAHAVARYVLLGQRFVQVEQRLRKLSKAGDAGQLRDLMIEQRALAAELRRHEIALRITPAARSSGAPGALRSPPDESQVEGAGLVSRGPR